MNRCLTCGKIVPRGHGYKSTQKYCNLQCYHDRFQINRGELLNLLNETDNVTITADIMGIHRETLYSYLKRNNIRRHIQWA
jgi:transcriptional regulator of acetoin/glycerol metabolism